MIRQAIVLAPPGDPGPLLRVGGLSLVKRAVLVLGRAGVERVWVASADASVRAAVERDGDFKRAGVTVIVVAERPTVSGPVVVVTADRVFDVAVAKAAVAAELFDIDACVTAAGVIAIADFAKLGTQGLREREVAIGAAFWQLVDSRAAGKRAEDALFAALRKRVDGPVARWINRRVSLFVTRRLIRTSITPNQMTLVANVFGLAGVICVFQATWAMIMLGTFLVQMQSILDGCDGEIARLELKSSKFGEWLDNVLDDHLNMAYGVALGYASTQLLAHSFGQSLWLPLGIGSAIAFGFHNFVMYYQLARVHRSGNPFHFRWWFEKGTVDVTEMVSKPGLGMMLAGALRSCVRRDVFLLAFFLLALAHLPQVATAWYAAVAASQSGFMLVHVLAGGVGKARTRQAA